MFRVHEVLEDSPATDAGIAEGDIITAIDGSAAATFTLSEIIDLFEKPVARELTIRRKIARSEPRSRRAASSD